ncbi:hypothetical protein [Pseudomonas sp.]|jgi:hypothetical protein|uniref:hypothetical protein n=1 Tax=Pseudomonas sp. TaxID=306 RepID=UPI002ED8B20E
MTEPFKVNVTMDFEAAAEDDIAQMYKDVTDMIHDGASSGNGTLPDGRGSYTFRTTQNRIGTRKSIAQQAMEMYGWWTGLSDQEQQHWVAVAESEDIQVVYAAYQANHPGK